MKTKILMKINKIEQKRGQRNIFIEKKIGGKKSRRFRFSPTLAYVKLLQSDTALLQVYWSMQLMTSYKLPVLY